MARVQLATAGLLLLAATLAAAQLPTCGTACTTDGDCVLASDGCSVCRNNKCTAQCGASCNQDADCGLIPGVAAAALVGSDSGGSTNNGCYVCYFNQCGSQYCGAQCTDNSQCQQNALCNVCNDGACSPPPTPKPSVPPTPHPPTPPPTPAPGKAGWGAVACGPSNCGDSMYFNFGATQAQAEAIALESCPTGNGSPVVYASWTQPLPCAAMVVSESFIPFFVNSTDLGTATTQAVTNCRNAGHTTCFLNFAACAEFPPTGAKWGAISTANSPESNGGTQLDTNNGQGYDTWQDAVNATMADCNAQYGTCGLTGVFYNCMAFSTDTEDASAVNYANSLSAAQSAAVKSCTFESQGTGGCTVISSACIAPYHLSNDHTVTGGRSWSKRRSLLSKKHKAQRH